MPHVARNRKRLRSKAAKPGSDLHPSQRPTPLVPRRRGFDRLGSELAGAVGMTPAGKETARTQGTPGLERWRGKEDDSANSPKQDGHAEVDDEGQPKPGRLEVGQRLGEVDRRNGVNGLELDDQAFRNREVGPHFADGAILVGYGGWRLAGPTTPPRPPHRRAPPNPWRLWRPGGPFPPIALRTRKVAGLRLRAGARGRLPRRQPFKSSASRD
jgi:hypothetical protein